VNNYRIEKDSLGEVQVEADKLWGPQTQRSYNNFKIGHNTMPIEIIKAIALIKKNAAIVNSKLNLLDKNKSIEIVKACDEIIDNKYNDQFPLSIYQTGSGTQTNMNVNEVIAHISNIDIHPNDDVNKGQSSNDVFPSAIHIAAVIETNSRLIPAITKLETTIAQLETEFADIIKIGRTHLQDATPLTLGQEFSGYRSMLKTSKDMIIDSYKYLYPLAIGGTAVGTGLNTHNDFGNLVAEKIKNETNFNFYSSDNKFHSLTSRDALLLTHGTIKTLATNLMKIANDIRLLASGPNCGIGEIIIPANEPGSSIMPGKVNPTQVEALTMVCVKVMGNDTTLSIANSQGNFELNVYMPVMIASYLESIELLTDSINSFNDNCVVGIKANKSKIKENLDKSLMLVTCLNPYIGYENSAKIAKYAYSNNLTLKESAIKLNILTAEEFDEYFKIESMI
jgi:fumarate hydratase class II